MKRLRIPETITIEIDGKSVGPFPYSQFVRSVFDNDMRANENAVKVRASVLILNAIQSAVEGDVIEMPDDDFALLADIIEAPQGGYPCVMITQADKIIPRPIVRQMLSYIDSCRAEAS